MLASALLSLSVAGLFALCPIGRVSLDRLLVCGLAVCARRQARGARHPLAARCCRLPVPQKHIPGKSVLVVTNETIAPMYLDR